MDEPVLKVEDRGAVRLVTMNRPAKRNALDFALTEALVAAFAEADADHAVRCVVLTGAGRAFCAGADRTEFADLTPKNEARVEERAALTMRLHAMIPQCRPPVVAAVNGFAMGGGAGLALACDQVVAGRSARLAYPELGHGLVAAVVMASLVRDAGRKLAFDLLASGRWMEPGEMHRRGLASAVVDDELLLDEAMQVAGRVAGYSPEAVAATKRLLQEVADLGLQEGLDRGRQTNARMRAFATEAHNG